MIRLIRRKRQKDSEVPRVEISVDALTWERAFIILESAYDSPPIGRLQCGKVVRRGNSGRRCQVHLEFQGKHVLDVMTSKDATLKFRHLQTIGTCADFGDEIAGDLSDMA